MCGAFVFLDLKFGFSGAINRGEGVVPALGDGDAIKDELDFLIGVVGNVDRTV